MVSPWCQMTSLVVTVSTDPSVRASARRMALYSPSRVAPMAAAAWATV